ncbi:platelet endothelial aggregation receptor 1-like [Ostrea edulis]|uniref:platelet endothelial aggregation receptor 1-like n=1 Tax=Ostrea edulis TaxID=37623 RepID=UPI0024AF066D|nr:platelet endothelial aggregation receptor 1-like [Ostrea edulis]
MDSDLFPCLIFWFLCPYIPSSVSKLCGSRGGIVCCSGYQWNEAQRNCTRCMDGFYGTNCNIPCPYPMFGWRCHLECMCGSEDCHHVYGCRRNTSECAVGKYGEYCELSCRYPNYGNGCQLFCHCNEASCDPSSGCTDSSSTVYSIEPSTSRVSTPRTHFESSTHYDEAAPKSTNILQMDKMSDADKGRVYESNSTYLVAGIISLLIVAGILMILCTLTYLHEGTCRFQRDTD